MKLKINNVPGYSGTINVTICPNGVPCDKFWRNRLKDAQIDGCVEVIEEKPTKIVKEKSE